MVIPVPFLLLCLILCVLNLCLLLLRPIHDQQMWLYDKV